LNSNRSHLMSFDLTGTLAEIAGPSHTQRLAALSPLPPDDVRKILHEVMGLKTLPSLDALTPDLVERTCAALQIDSGELGFGQAPLTPYRLLPGANAVVAAAAEHGHVALITNTSVFAEDCLVPVQVGLAPHLAAIHSSWRLGVAKPDPRIFRSAAAHHGVAVENLVHVGDRWDEDIAPVLALGGHAMWVTTADDVAGREHVCVDRLLIVRSLREAAEAMTRRWWA